MPARNRRVFSPPLNPFNGRKREIPANCHASSAAWARSSIFQSSSSRTKCSSAASPFRMAWRAVSLRSMPNACATVRPSYCPKCWGTWKRCPEQYALPPPGDQGGLSATVVACQRGLFSGIDNQIEVGKQNFLIGMDIAEVFDNDTHKNTVFRVDNIGVRMTHFQLSQGCGEQTNTVRAKHTPFE